jgi:hypothetical protein
MKTHSLFFLSGIVLLSLYACKKEKDEVVTNTSPSPAPYENYTALKAGNYWIYEEFSVDSTGNGSGTGNLDSCYVEKDTTVNGNVYHKLVKLSDMSWPNYAVLLLRDSLAYTVNEEGDVFFSSLNFTSVFNLHYIYGAPDTVAKISSQMVNHIDSTVVPAGTFLTMDFRTTYNMYYPFTSGGYTRYAHARYAKNIGLISETLPFYAISPVYTERRLVRYHLE